MQSARSIHIQGILLFLFIPLVLFLFLRFPFGIPISFGAAIAIMFAHRLIARPFFLKHRNQRCFWCGRTSRTRAELNVDSLAIQACTQPCLNETERFFSLCMKYRIWIAAGIFVPLVWYIVTMLLVHFRVFSFPIEWNRFIFQFFIACTVVTISFAYKKSSAVQSLSFPFPIHNLFLLGVKNTLLVFRLVGIWWIAASLFFLYGSYRGKM